jgi:hypothetical protein
LFESKRYLYTFGNLAPGTYTVTEIQLGNAPDALTGDNNKAIFRLYSDAGCNTQVNQDEKVLLSFANASATTGTAATSTGYAFNPAAGATQTGILYWRVTYTGDTYNGTYTTPCGPGPNGEKTTVMLDPH